MFVWIRFGVWKTNKIDWLNLNHLESELLPWRMVEYVEFQHGLETEDFLELRHNIILLAVNEEWARCQAQAQSPMARSKIEPQGLEM